MKAVVPNSNVTGYLELGESVNSAANTNEALISVTISSLNRNELRRDETVPAGTRILGFSTN